MFNFSQGTTPGGDWNVFKLLRELHRGFTEICSNLLRELHRGSQNYVEIFSENYTGGSLKYAQTCLGNYTGGHWIMLKFSQRIIPGVHWNMFKLAQGFTPGVTDICSNFLRELHRRLLKYVQTFLVNLGVYLWQVITQLHTLSLGLKRRGAESYLWKLWLLSQSFSCTVVLSVISARSEMILSGVC